MDKFFITATGTDIGKTLVVATLCQQLQAAGKKMIALKPVISGYDSEDMGSDSALILQSCGLSVTTENIEKISPWRFSTPLSPNMAAQREEKKILLDELVVFCQKQEKTKADILLVEGIGGVCTPLNDKYTVLDWIIALNDWKIILVTGNYLGSISHTLTAVKTLAACNLKLHALIVSESENSSVPLVETIQTLANFLPKSVSIVCVSRQKEKIWEKMPKISEICL